MTQETRLLAEICRPRILVKAARIAGKSYKRESALSRLFKIKRPPSGTKLILALKEHEAALELARRQGDATYIAQKHVEVLTALIAENRRI